MIDSIKAFFGRFIEPGMQPADAGGEMALRLASAALLLEMVRMDGRLDEVEQGAVVDALRRQFGLDPAALDELLRLAAEEAREASGYHQFTSLINKTCDAGQKVRIVENLWRVAMVDGHLDAHESHLVRKIADLLHVSHADYIAAKSRARTATGLPAA